MMTERKIYYYVAVSSDNGRLILLDGRLPIFWNKKTALATLEGWENVTIKRIKGIELQKIIV